jgi:SsrA-binding protein
MNITNKKAFVDYVIQDRVEAGIVLAGHEVKSLRGGHAKLEGSFVRIIGSEAYLVGAQIYPYAFARVEQYDPARTRKLLLHKREILALKQKMDAGGLTLVPLSWYTTGYKVKLEIGLAKGKKQYEKREVIKRRDMKKELERRFRGKVK